jgi:hypothetical protein
MGPCVYAPTSTRNTEEKKFPQDAGELLCKAETKTGAQSCDCSCDDLAEPDPPPPFVIMSLSFFSQSCIACIVGSILGLRDANLEVWRKSIKRVYKSKGMDKSKSIDKNMLNNDESLVSQPGP